MSDLDQVPKCATRLPLIDERMAIGSDHVGDVDFCEGICAFDLQSRPSPKCLDHLPCLYHWHWALEAFSIQKRWRPVSALIAEAQRELDLRRQFYWAKVRAGKMRQDDAHLRIALMEAIVKRLTVTANS